MKHTVYRLKFHSSVHFGSGMLASSEKTFCADVLFSALYIEALKFGDSHRLLQEVRCGKLLFSDAFPYSGSRYFVPRPQLFIDQGIESRPEERKFFKKLREVPVDQMDEFLSGRGDEEKLTMGSIGSDLDQVMSATRCGQKSRQARQFVVRSFLFNEGCGLFIIVKTENEDIRALFEKLLKSLSYTGIGGKRTQGKGRFSFERAEDADAVIRFVERKSERGNYMLLSTALPADDELDEALEGATYTVQQRSGYVYSKTFSAAPVKKKNLYTLKAGSCFKHEFDGDIYDVGDGKGTHPVYRYAKAMFAGL